MGFWGGRGVSRSSSSFFSGLVHALVSLLMHSVVTPARVFANRRAAMMTGFGRRSAAELERLQTLPCPDHSHQLRIRTSKWTRAGATSSKTRVRPPWRGLEHFWGLYERPHPAARSTPVPDRLAPKAKREMQTGAKLDAVGFARTTKCRNPRPSAVFLWMQSRCATTVVGRSQSDDSSRHTPVPLRQKDQFVPQKKA